MKCIILSIVSICISLALFSQTDISGTWSFKEKQQLSGQEYTNAVPEKIIAMQGQDSIVFDVESGDESGQMVKSHLVYPLKQGIKPLITIRNGQKYERSAEWNDRIKTLRLKTHIYTKDNDQVIEYTRIDDFSLTGNGKSLKLLREYTDAKKLLWKVKAVYTKK